MNTFTQTTSSTDFTAIKNMSLGTLIRDRLLTMIMSGDLVPGQQLKEPEIVEEF